MQDVVAILIAVASAAWLVRSLARRWFATPCRPPVTGGGDGFVPLERLRHPEKESGRP